MILWVESASPYELTIEIYFTSIIMAHENFSSGSWLFSITMLLSIMSRENMTMILQCTDAQRLLIKESHMWFHAHYDVNRTILHLTQRHPLLETSADNWPHLRHDVRAYIQSCFTCQKMSRRNQIIRASGFTNLRPMQWIQ